MSSGDIFWIRLVSIVSFTLVVGVLSLLARVSYDNYIIDKMVLNGVDPIAAKCSLEGRNPPDMCTTYIIVNGCNKLKVLEDSKKIEVE